MKKILVIGSSNTDLIAKMKEFPKPGETITGISYLQAMGGKGANQALAAHRLGGNVQFITCLGKDDNGRNSIEYYKKEGLDVSRSLFVDNVPSGVAIIWVDENGENSIVVISGANGMLSSDYIHQIENEISNSDLIVLQMEIPYDTVKTVCEIAGRLQKKVLLNVAPATQLEDEILKNIDILVVNQVEAETISKMKINDAGEEPVIDKLLDMGANTVILTLGKRGSMLKNANVFHHVPAFVVKAVDTTAAGDTFCGAIAAEICRGSNWEDSLRFASAASAICVTRMGAQPSIPSEREVRDFLNAKITL